MKRLIPILLAALLLTACSGFPEEEPSPSASADPDEPVLTKRNIELTVWENPGAGEEFIQQAAAVFNQKYPNIRIRCVAVEPSGLLSRIASESASGTVDLFTVPHTDIRQLADARLVLPARDQAKTRSAIFPASAQTATVNGILYGYPVSAETTALFYNKQLITEDELPSTWAGLADFAKGFNDGDRYGFVMPVGSAYAAAPFISARNNRPFGLNGENEQTLNLETSAALEGMSIFQSLRSAVGLSSEELSLHSVESLFASGKAALCIAGPWNIARFTAAGINFGVAPLPAFPGEEVGSSSLTFARVMLVSAYSENPDEASAFAAHLLTEEMQRLRVELTGELPSVDTALRSPSYIAGFAAQMRNAFAYTSLPAAYGFWESFGDVCARIWDGANMKEELSSFWQVPESEPEPE
ncbi:MAG: extracellular solute-binding protein [Oscillospiraceae bacterium]|jgi:arabinogalactan oligomer/maltooligosaccharide transport system substrate-binding protein|nr:extracellular solute-binding protein [Oscillospiraceae bacterium]